MCKNIHSGVAHSREQNWEQRKHTPSGGTSSRDDGGEDERAGVCVAAGTRARVTQSFRRKRSAVAGTRSRALRTPGLEPASDSARQAGVRVDAVEASAHTRE